MIVLDGLAKIRPRGDNKHAEHDYFLNGFQLKCDQSAQDTCSAKRGFAALQGALPVGRHEDL
jgi:hypothetical protein